MDGEFSDERKTLLDPTADFSDRAGLYGSYGITVYKDAKTARAEAAQDIGGDKPIAPADGIYWDQYPGDDSWEARRTFLNFVLDWEAPDERKVTDERWDRLVRIAGAIAEDGELPAEDRPCDQAGIDPAKGKEGTCKQGSQTLIVVNRGNTLKAPGIDARLVDVRQDDGVIVTEIEIRNKTGKEMLEPVRAPGGRWPPLRGRTFRVEERLSARRRGDRRDHVGLQGPEAARQAGAQRRRRAPARRRGAVRHRLPTRPCWGG